MESKVKGPAVGLIVVAVLSAILYVVDLVTAVFGLGGDPAAQIEAMDLPEEVKDVLVASEGGAVGILWSVVGLGASYFIFHAARKMLRLEGHTTAMVASVLVMVPCLTHCCVCVPGLGVGLWSLIVLMREDVKEAFAS